MIRSIGNSIGNYKTERHTCSKNKKTEENKDCQIKALSTPSIIESLLIGSLNNKPYESLCYVNKIFNDVSKKIDGEIDKYLRRVNLVDFMIRPWAKEPLVY